MSNLRYACSSCLLRPFPDCLKRWLLFGKALSRSANRPAMLYMRCSHGIVWDPPDNKASTSKAASCVQIGQTRPGRAAASRKAQKFVPWLDCSGLCMLNHRMEAVHCRFTPSGKHFS